MLTEIYISQETWKDDRGTLRDSVLLNVDLRDGTRFDPDIFDDLALNTPDLEIAVRKHLLKFVVVKDVLRVFSYGPSHLQMYQTLAGSNGNILPQCAGDARIYIENDKVSKRTLFGHSRSLLNANLLSVADSELCKVSLLRPSLSPWFTIS